MVTVSLRMEDSMKRRLDEFCDELGINTTTFFMIYAKKALRERRIPFSLEAPIYRPKSLEEMSKEEFDAMLAEGFKQAKAGMGRPADEVFDELEKRLASNE